MINNADFKNLWIHFSKDEIRKMIVDYFNKTYIEHLPVTKANVRIEVERGHHQECDHTIHAIIEI